MMRNYEVMRCVLYKAAHTTNELRVRDFACCGTFEEIREELDRLKEEELIEHNIVWESSEFSIGTITGATPKGKSFLRTIENEDVWAIIYRTLEAANLDLSYPLLKEVCETVVKRYVMGKIPKEL